MSSGDPRSKNPRQRGTPQAKGSRKPSDFRKPAVNENNYSFDYSVNVRDVERFSLYKRLFAIEVGKQFGECARIIEHGEHFAIYRPDIPDEDDWNDEVEGARIRMEYNTDYSAYVKQKSVYESKCTQLYHLIWSKCTVAMRNAVKEHVDFDTWDREKDALSLWIRVTDISLNGTGEEENNSKRINEARHRFDRIHQRQNESVGEFYDRFNEHYDVMVSNGAFLLQIFYPEGLTHAQRAEMDARFNIEEEEMKAMSFLNKLDKLRFGGMLDDLDNNKQFGRDEYPTTLVGAYTMANRYRKNGNRVDSLYKGKADHFDAVFNTFTEKKKPARNENGGKKGKGNREVKCYLCDNLGHVQTKCPQLNKALQLFLKSGKSLEQLEKSAKEGSILVSFSGLEEYIFTEQALRPFSTQDILLDNQASISVFCNPNYLSNIRDAESEIYISGISKDKLKTNLIGDVKGFGTVYYNPDAIANILCFFDINKMFGVQFNGTYFSVKVPELPKLIVFHPYGKLYLCKNANFLSVSNGAGDISLKRARKRIKRPDTYTLSTTDTSDTANKPAPLLQCHSQNKRLLGVDKHYTPVYDGSSDFESKYIHGDTRATNGNDTILSSIKIPTGGISRKVQPTSTRRDSLKSKTSVIFQSCKKSGKMDTNFAAQDLHDHPSAEDSKHTSVCSNSRTILESVVAGCDGSKTMTIIPFSGNEGAFLTKKGPIPDDDQYLENGSSNEDSALDRSPKPILQDGIKIPGDSDEPVKSDDDFPKEVDEEVEVLNYLSTPYLHTQTSDRRSEVIYEEGIKRGIDGCTDGLPASGSRELLRSQCNSRVVKGVSKKYSNLDLSKKYQPQRILTLFDRPTRQAIGRKSMTSPSCRNIVARTSEYSKNSENVHMKFADPDLAEYCGYGIGDDINLEQTSRAIDIGADIANLKNTRRDINDAMKSSTAEKNFTDPYLYPHIVHGPNALLPSLNSSIPGNCNMVDHSNCSFGPTVSPNRAQRGMGTRPQSAHHIHSDDIVPSITTRSSEQQGYENQLVLTTMNQLIDPHANSEVLINTVDNNLKKFTKKEIKQADLARQLYSMLGKPAMKDFISMINHNLISNCPVTVNDVKRATLIYGKDLGAIMGRTLSYKPKPINDDIFIREEEDHTVLYMDIMFILGLAFLISISKGYNVLVVRFINDRKMSTIEKAIRQTLSSYSKHNVKVNMIICDGEGAISALKASIEGMGVQLEQSSKNEHVATIDRAIRQVKERVRAFKNELPFNITKEILVYLVYYLVSMINSVPRSTSVLEMSPKEKLSGKKLDYNIDFQLEFAEFCYVNEENTVKNSLKSRTFPGICLGPVGNIQGSYYFLNLNTWQVVKRRGFIKVPLPNDIITRINNKAAREQERYGSGDARFRLDDLDDLNDENQDEEEIIDQDENDVDEEVNQSGDNEIDKEAEVVEWDYEPHYWKEENEDGNPIGSEKDEEESKESFSKQPQSRYNLRQTPQREKWRAKNNADVFVLYKFIMATYNIRKAIQDYGDEGIESMTKEMKQLHDKGVFEAVNPNNLTNKQRLKILRTLMLVKRKRNNLLKSRFLADGSKQIRSLSEIDPSSPTVSIESVFIQSAIDAMERRYHATIDVEGAYLHADMTEEVYIRVEPQIAELLIKIDKKYDKDKQSDGSLVLKLKKALYGCIQSARLFYENISKSLLDFGFKKNDYDQCVFNKEMYGKQCTILIHVDDLKISCQDRRGVQDVINYLKKCYGNINVHEEDIVDYLGMDFDYSKPGLVSITMKGLIDQVLDDVPVTKISRTPASVELFTVNENSKELDKDKREKFHSVVAKLLYMAKRARPDILTAVAFLTTRVLKSTEQDWIKLERIIQYLKGTRELSLNLTTNDDITINAFIDASFACHPDGKSHTGEVITLGGGAVISKSSKQKLVTRSSTEAELVGLSDGTPTVLWVKNFLESQGYDVGPAIVHQDNKSTMILAEKGKSTTNRTRHINIRYFFIKDRIESGDVKVIYTQTEEMVADFFSKPLQGQLFEKFRDIIMNTNNH